ncbi:MAG TPA: OmpA family protein [Chthoniobacterales bacterium]|nr:OmpA family protein [Chthoniobacterales bacterium]
MRVSNFDQFDELDYNRALLSGTGERNWLWLGLIGSLALHLALCAYFYRARFQSVESVVVPNQPTITFKVKNVDLAQLEKSSSDQTSAAAKPEPNSPTDQQPDEKKAFDKLLQEVQASTAMPDDIQNVLPDKPKVEPDITSVLPDIERSTAQTLSNSPNATHEQSAPNDTAVSGRPQPALSGTELATSTSIKRPSTFTSKLPADSAGPERGRAGFSDLDQLLAQKGPLGSGTKLQLPDDQLFEYDSAELRPSDLLSKVATLIRRNPKATFTVEGYTDSFGTPEYNLDLSQRRADSVKQYLVQVMGISPDQIEARGYGQTKFRVSPNGSIGEQRENRRVEIVVHTNEP